MTLSRRRQPGGSADSRGQSKLTQELQQVVERTDLAVIATHKLAFFAHVGPKSGTFGGEEILSGGDEPY